MRLVLTSVSAQDSNEIEKGIRAPADKPVELQPLETADLPPAASYPYGLVYNATLNNLSYSTGSAWVSFGTGSLQNTGTSGANLPLLNGANTWSGVQLHTAAFGYGTGAGGTVTQLTSKSTAVTLNKLCGAITMHNASLAAGASVSFVLNNSLIAEGDFVGVMLKFGSNNSYVVNAGTMFVGGGAVNIHVRNESAGALAEAITLTFVIIKGATS